MITNKDGYKAGHYAQYPEGTELVYSNWTPRGSRIPEIDKIVFFGLQYYIKEYLIRQFNEDFFDMPKAIVVPRYKRRMDNYLGPNMVSTDHIEALHDLGYLPVHIRALPEGAQVPLGCPMFTIENTLPAFYWVTNMLETSISNTLWLPCTIATLAKRNLEILKTYADQTGANPELIPFLAHDFSMRGMASMEAAKLSGAAHLLSSLGTDTIPAIDFLEDYYGADSDKEAVGLSVPATEHSVMCMGGDTAGQELETYRRLIEDTYPSGIVSIVSDTWDFWATVTVILPQLKDKIMTRDGKVVIRPDCYDDQTEILTPQGWKYFSQLDDEDLVAQVDDDVISFVKPTKIVKQEYEGNMHYFSDYHGKVDLLVTPNHRMVLEQGGKERIVEADALGQYGHHKQKMRRSAKAQGASDLKLSPLDRLRIAFQADGSFCTGCEPNHIRFSFSKERKKKRLIDTAEQAGLSISTYELNDGSTEFHLDVGTKDFRKDFDWADPLIPNVNCEQFIEELSYWDATRRSNDRFKFDTTNRKVADQVTLIAQMAGYGALLSHKSEDREDHFSDVFTVHIMKDNSVGGQSWKNTVVPYKGTVHCVTVPSGKVLIRRNRCTMVSGNSGDPVKILCGDPDAPSGSPEHDGLIEVLWDIFGGTTNDKGFRTLDPHIGAIYGDSITTDRMESILHGLRNKEFTSDNVVFGIGSFSYQYNTRDTFNFAMKATAGKVKGEYREIYKDPKTGDGSKKSAKGFIRIDRDENGDYSPTYPVSHKEAAFGALIPVFTDGRLLKEQTLTQIRETLHQ